MSISTEVVWMGFPQDTGGTVRRVDASTVVDDVFIFQDAAGIKWERVVDGPYRAAWCATSSGNQTSRLQATLNHAKVKDVVFDDGDVTINGTLTVPAGKKLVFRNGGAVTGSGTITGSGSFAADPKAHVFKGTVNVRIKPDTNEWVVQWFGAKGDGSQDEQPFIQRCVDAGIAAGVHRWYIPSGTYPTGKGILFRKDNGSGEPVFFMNAVIRGDGKAYGTNSPNTHTKIVVAANSFGFGIDRGKGVIVDGIGFEGQNFAVYSLSVAALMEDENAVWVSPGVRDDSWSPHAGIVIDPFTNATFATANPTKVYPGFESYYVNTAAGGSTDIKVSNCYARQLVVGFAITPHPTPQNGDHIEVCDTWSEYNKVGFTLGQSQNRTIAFNRIACWGGTETVFDCRRYGDGTSGTCEANNVNIAGGVKYLCRIPGFDQNNGLTIRDCHAELMWALGGSIGDGSSERSGTLRVINSFINLLGPDSYGVYGCKTIYKGKFLVLENTSILNLQGTAFRVHNIDALGITVTNCGLESMYTFGTVNTQNSGYQLVNTFISNATASSDLNWSLGFYFAEASDKFTPIIGAARFEDNLIQNGWPPRVWTKMPRQRPTGQRDAQPGYYILDLGSLLFSAVDYSSRTATLSLTPNGDVVRHMYTDLVLYGSGTNQFGDNVWVDIGHVNTVNVSTGVVTLKHLNTYQPTGGQFVAGNSYNLAIMRIPKAIHADVIGDITSGSAVITNVDTNTNGFFFPPGDVYIDSPHFPAFTRITGYNRTARTMTVSHPANKTMADVPICDVQFKREMYFSDTPPQPVGWRVGDIIYNNFATPANNNILYWICTSPGMAGAAQGDGSFSSRTASFKPIYKVDPSSGGGITIVDQTLTSDGTIVIPINKYCTRILVKPSSSLSAFKIGLSAGASDVITEQPVAAGAYIPFDINRLAEGSALTLYIGGITSSTDLKIYYE